MKIGDDPYSERKEALIPTECQTPTQPHENYRMKLTPQQTGYEALRKSEDKDTPISVEEVSEVPPSHPREHQGNTSSVEVKRINLTQMSKDTSSER